MCAILLMHDARTTTTAEKKKYKLVSLQNLKHKNHSRMIQPQKTQANN